MPHTCHCKFCVLRSLQLSIWLKDFYNSCFQVYVLYIYISYTWKQELYKFVKIVNHTLGNKNCTSIYIKHTLGNKNCTSLLTI